MELKVYIDCKSLMEHFLDSGQLNFKGFCQSWHHNSFQHIWCAQTSYTELIQTTTAILHFAKRTACGLNYNGHPIPYLDNEQSHAYQIFGIYFMYAVYFNQPTEKFVKIEVSPTTWSILRGYVDNLRQTYTTREAIEASYIFWRLFKANAFRFTAHDFCSGLEGLVNYDRPPKKIAKSTDTVSEQERSLVLNLITDLPQITKTAAMLPPLESLEQRYNQMKCELSRTDANSKALPTTSAMTHELQKVIGNIGQLLDKLNSCETDEGDGNSNSKDSFRLGVRRRNLKRNAAFVVAKPKAKFDEKKQTNLEGSTGAEEHGEEDDDDDIVELTSKDFCQRRLSAHTIFAKKLPVSISREVDVEDAEEISTSSES